MNESKPKKAIDLLAKIRRCIEEERFLDTHHSAERRFERFVSRPDIIYVLRHGWHEKSKDTFDELHHAWNYAIRGKSVDGRPLRVVVSFDESQMLIITVMNLDRKNGNKDNR